MTTATGYHRLALDLDEYISNYMPGNWQEPIRSIHPTPIVMPDHARSFLEAYRRGCLEDLLEKTGEKGDLKDRQFSPWFVKEAVRKFYESEAFREYEEELS